MLVSGRLRPTYLPPLRLGEPGQAMLTMVACPMPNVRPSARRELDPRMDPMELTTLLGLENWRGH